MWEKAGLHENWWKSLLLCLKQTGHNLCINLCFDHLQSRELKRNLFQNGMKDLNFLVQTLIRKHYGPLLQFDLCLCEWEKIFVSNWHYDHFCDLVHTHVNELKFMFQIGTVVFPMLLTNAFHFTNLFLIFVLTLFLSVTEMLLYFLQIKNTQPAIRQITS